VIAGILLPTDFASDEEDQMIIILNGDRVEVAGPLTISTLLVQLGVDPRRVAVEHNLNVIKRTNYDATEIQNEDQIEIVNFVGGGA
jgi:thiamine biosynthesis protein ThiS